MFLFHMVLFKPRVKGANLFSASAIQKKNFSASLFHLHYVQSPTLDEIWHEDVSISGSSLHLTSQFSKGWVRCNPNSNMVSEPIQEPLYHSLPCYHYRVTWIMLQMFSPRRGRGVVLGVSHWGSYGLKMCL